MTKRIVSGIFILTALGALGVILAGALTSGEQLIVRFLTAVIVAALGLYVISDLRLQADDDAMTSRGSGSGRLKAVDAPPNSTAAFMATVTRKTEILADDSEEENAEEVKLVDPLDPAAKELVALGEPEEAPAELAAASVFGDFSETVVLEEADQKMVGVGASASTTGDFATGTSEFAAASSGTADNNGVGREDLGFINKRVVPSRPNAPETVRTSDLPGTTDATVTDIFAGINPPSSVPLTTDDDVEDASGSEGSDENPPAEDDADLTQLLQLNGGLPSPLGIVSEFKSGDAPEPSETAVARANPFENGATSAKISFSSDPIGDNVSFGSSADQTGSDEKAGDGQDVLADQTQAIEFEVHDLADLDEPVEADPIAEAGDDNAEATEGALNSGAVESTDGAEFEYSGDLQSADLAWPAPPAKLNGSKKAHPFDKIARNGSDKGIGERNGHSTTLPIPTSPIGMQATDYADAPLAPIIDLRDISGHNSDNIDVAINAGEVEVIATLIEQGMLSTDGAISDRDVRTMVYVAFTSNELRKLLLAGGSPDGPNYGLDLGPVELFDERIHAPAPKRLYPGMDRPEPQSQIG